MFKKVFVVGVAAFGLSMGMTLSAAAHNVLNVWEGPAGQLFPMKLNVNHGCKGSLGLALHLQRILGPSS